MEFRRIDRLPPYVFNVVNDLKASARRAGEDIIDLGMGNPDLATPSHIVDKLTEAAENPRNHRYSTSRGIPKLRKAIVDWYDRRYNVMLDAETEAMSTMGAKEAISHMAWTLVAPGDTCLVPEPTYPIHTFSVALAGADVRSIPLGPDQDFFENMKDAYEGTWPRPRLIITSFPHNPTTTCVDLSFFEQLVAFAKEHEMLVIHDFAYADLTFDEYQAPSLLQVPGAKDVGVEIFSMSKSFSMAGWRIAFVVGNPEMVAALTRLKSYLDYGVFQPIQIAAIIALNECEEETKVFRDTYRARRDTLIEGLARAGWNVPSPKATMFVWAEIPEEHRTDGSLEFAKFLLKEGKVAVSPGVGFGRAGDRFVRFALVENEHRIRQATRGIRKALGG
ncbi:MAG: aminotransferase class I/II-fold pyridoxal phosphate-dependent enzyme [Actinobacteria bacterium]|nr:MAG: aminotransferase class I/II-fold pyridoxal phosphate-dependent enzyme [Actinomycetota bacterium]